MHKLVPSHMGFEGTFWQMALQPVAPGCTTEGFSVAVWEFWRILSNVDYQCLIRWIGESLGLELRHNVAAFFFCTLQWCQSLMGVMIIVHLYKVFLISVWITDVFFVLRDEILPQMHHSFCKHFTIRLFLPRVSHGWTSLDLIRSYRPLGPQSGTRRSSKDWCFS